MALSRETLPLTADDDTLRRALEDAFLPALLPALAQATGDFSILRDDVRPVVGVPAGVPQGGMTPDQQEKARALAFEALKNLRDNGPQPSSRPIVDDLRAITLWMTGSPATDDYIPYLLEELAPEGQDPRAPQWRMESGKQFKVAIIGAGMSGILAAIRLKQAGVPYVILEKNADVGGTWLENSYPGARVDVSNAFYSYSFAQKVDWPQHFSSQGVLLDYFRDCAAEFGIRENIRFNTEVTWVEWDDASARWKLHITSSGKDEVVEANAVISAVGQLNRPKMPDIKGIETFKGPSFHSARWNHSVELKGKKVAVIGTGASAAQFIPAIAPEVGELTVYQRTPPWLVPVPHYYDDVPEGQRYVMTHVPHYVHWNRFWLFWTTTEGLLPAAQVDESWDKGEQSVSQRNDELRQLLTGYMQMQFGDRPDLFEKCLPKYAPASKRLVLDNGIWANTLKRDNVTVVSDRIREVSPNGIVTEDGTERPADVIIYGTGFQASRFLTPMKVTGRGGVDLHKQWDGDARAYLGITVPNFPNLFLLYGPNTNIVVNGSIIYFSECEVRYAMDCLRTLIQNGHRAMDCRGEVHDAYNRRIDEANRKMVWGVAKVPSWYRNDKGRSAQNWPFNLVEYWKQTKEVNPADYELIS